MLFSSEDGREHFFEQMEADPRRISYGAAMGHAAGVNLGMFGSESSLAEDVARVMLIELRKYQRERHSQPEDLDVRKLDTHHIRQTKAFKEAFAFARRGPKQRLGGVLGALADNAGNTELKRAANYEMQEANRSRSVDLTNAHERIYAELQGYGRGLFKGKHDGEEDFEGGSSRRRNARSY